IPPQVLGRRNVIQLRNLSPVSSYTEPHNELGRQRRNILFIDRLRLAFPTLLFWPGDPEQQIVYRLSPRELAKGKILSFKAMHRDGFLLYDVKRGTFHPDRRVTITDPEDSVFCCAGTASLKRVAAIHPLRQTTAHLDA